MLFCGGQKRLGTEALLWGWAMTDRLRKNAPKSRGRPFQKGNPGKPKGARHRASILAEKLMSDDVEAIARAVIDAAKTGDMVAARMILDRLVPVRRGCPVELSLPATADAKGLGAAFDALIAGVAAGELSPEEAQSVGALLEGRRRIIETVEIEQRVAALEQAARSE